MAAAASTQGTALGTMQGSCRPTTRSASGVRVCRFTLRCSLEMEGVGLNAAPQPCSFKADAEFNALDGGDPEYNGGNAALHTVKQRAAQTCGQTQHGTFHHAAYGVTLRLGGGNSRLHGRPCGVVCRREGLARRGDGQGGGILHRSDGGDAADNGNAPLFQQLKADAPGNAQGGCQPPGKSAAAGVILMSAVFHLSGVVGVAGAGDHRKIGVVPGAGVGVADDGGKGRAAGDIFHQPGETFRRVGLIRLLLSKRPDPPRTGDRIWKRTRCR